MKFRIREARKKAGYTQVQLADMLGIKNTTLSGYEVGDSDPKSDMLMKIADICGCSVDFLLFNDKHIKEEAPLSPAALHIARIYDNANDKIKAAFEAVAAITEA